MQLRLDNTPQNRPFSTWESFNTRKKLGLYVFYSYVANIGKVEVFYVFRTKALRHYKVALTQEDIQSMEKEIVCQG